jgi:hypothetical protein
MIERMEERKAREIGRRAKRGEKLESAVFSKCLA